MRLKHQLLRSSMVVGFFALLGSLTGILIETSIAAKLGLSKSSDTFYVAFTIPYIITNVLSATGQFSLVPFFTSLEARHVAEDLWRGFSYSVNMTFLGLTVIAAVGAAASPWVIRGIAPGFTRPQTELATQLSQWLFLMIIPAGVAEVFRSYLLSEHRFALASASGLIRNATVIFAIVFGFPHYGAYGIVLGYLGGYLVQLIILGIYITRKFQVRYTLTLIATGEAFRQLRGAGTAQVASAVLWQGVVIIERIIASFLPAGTLTALNYGFKILSTLAELLAGSVGTATLPALSRAVARMARAEEYQTFRATLEIILVLVSPALVFCLLLDRNIIQLAFQRGNFTPQATSLLSIVFYYYSLSLPFYSFIRVFTFYLFARNEGGIFLRVSSLFYTLNVAFDLLYVGVLRMGSISIPLGLLTSLVITYALALQRNLSELRQVHDRMLGIFAIKNLLGASLAVLAIWGLRYWVPPPSTAGGNFFYLCILCGAGSLVFLATLVASRAIPVSFWVSLRQISDNP